MIILIQEIVKIGNSKGIRLSKPLLRELGIGSQVDLEIIETADHHKILQIRPVVSGRKNWTKGFNSGDSEPLIPEHVVHNWDLSEWTW